MSFAVGVVMKTYFLWAGGVLILVMLLVVFAGGLYPKHRACERFYQEYSFPEMTPDQTATAATPDWVLHADCQGVENNLYLSYYLVALGVALLGVGFVLRR